MKKFIAVLCLICLFGGILPLGCYAANAPECITENMGEVLTNNRAVLLRITDSNIFYKVAYVDSITGKFTVIDLPYEKVSINFTDNSAITKYTTFFYDYVHRELISNETYTINIDTQYVKDIMVLIGD